MTNTSIETIYRLRDDVHILIATTLSMILTFVFHGLMEHIPSRHSFPLLGWIDYFHDCGLVMRCYYNQGSIFNETCTYIFTINDVLHMGLYIVFMCLVFTVIYSFAKSEYLFLDIFSTFLIVDFLAQYIVYFNLSFNIDLVTIFWFIWQFASLVSNWMLAILLPPILIIEQVSFCINVAWDASIYYYILFRYIPLPINLSVLWMLSLRDIFLCLHHRGRFYKYDAMKEKLSQRMSSESVNYTGNISKRGMSEVLVTEDYSKSKYRTCVYYVDGIDEWETSAALGLGDFFIYNILILLALPPSSSILIKMCITLGTIVSIEVGVLLTYWLGSMAKKSLVPLVPLPVITVSIYLFILDIIIANKFNQCI